MSGHVPSLVFRIFPFNRLSIPFLLNIIEQSGLDKFFKIVLLDNFSDLKNFISEKNGGLLIYSFMTPHLPEIKRELDWIIETRTSDQKLIAGGPHTTGNPESPLKLGFDYAFSGPAESGFQFLLEKFLSDDLPESATVFYSKAVDTLDPFYPVSKYINTIPPLELTRGCNWNCTFCQTSCQRPIHRSFDSFKEFYRMTRQKKMHRRMTFISPSSFEFGSTTAKKLNPAAIEEILSYCRNNGTELLEYGIFPSETRPNNFRMEFLEIISSYCTNKKITIGAQSGSNRLLKLLRRGHNTGQIETACQITRDSGFRPLLDFILGFPEENRDDRHFTLKFVKKLASEYNARIHIHYFLPLSGTEMENSLPTPLDYPTIDLLKNYQRDGIATGWWKTGRVLSEKIIAIREILENRQIMYQVEYL